MVVVLSRQSVRIIGIVKILFITGFKIKSCDPVDIHLIFFGENLFFFHILG